MKAQWDVYWTIPSFKPSPFVPSLKVPGVPPRPWVWIPPRLRQRGAKAVRKSTLSQNSCDLQLLVSQKLFCCSCLLDFYMVLFWLYLQDLRLGIEKEREGGLGGGKRQNECWDMAHLKGLPSGHFQSDIQVINFFLSTILFYFILFSASLADSFLGSCVVVL